jgi:hypothetical protein
MRVRLLCALSTVGVLAACGGAKSADAPATESAMSTAGAPLVPTVYTITAKDYAYDAPDTMTAGMVTLRLVNQGPELHHVQLLRLDPGHTAAEFLEGMKRMKPTDHLPPWAHEVAGPNTPVPGGEQSVTQELTAGEYVIICMIPSPDLIPHAMKGMTKALTVIPSTGATAAAPTADITVKMTDYAWEVTPAITAGKHVIRLENEAAQPHEMFIAQLAPGKRAADLATWLEKQQGPPPGKPIGGTSGMAKGGVVYLPVDLEPGEYGLFCFLPDAKDGKMHIEHGMITQFAVK